MFSCLPLSIPGAHCALDVSVCLSLECVEVVMACPVTPIPASAAVRLWAAFGRITLDALHKLGDPLRLTEPAVCQVDVYSFGVVLWELWTGREPYEGLNYHALLHQITLTGGGLRPTLPNSPKWEYDPIPEPAPGWCSLMERCWQTIPEKRPSFAEVPCLPETFLLPHACMLTLCKLQAGFFQASLS